MRRFQDRFYSSVAINHGLARLGPKRRRLSRAEWNAENLQREADLERFRRLDEKLAFVTAKREEALEMVKAASAEKKDLARQHRELATAKEDRMLAERFKQEVEIILGKESPEFGRWVKNLAEATALMPPEKRNEYISIMQRTMAALIPKKEQVQQKTNSPDRGR